MDAARQALLDALAAHEPADDDERRDREAIAALVASTPRCFDRDLYEPGHITGSAFVLDARSGRVLLHHHRRLDRWLQLGGHDEGEHDPLQTALREAHEESGLTDLAPVSTTILDLDVHEIPAAKGEPPHLHHDVRYALATRTPREIAQAPESMALEWFPLDEAAELMAEPGATRALQRLAALAVSLRPD
jgi:8-oxo-dGTP pyrophosphatase MutT (NUDIX family)